MPDWPIILHSLFHFILFCSANPVLCMILSFAGLHTVELQPVSLLWMWILVYSLMCSWHACLCSCQWFPGPCFPVCCGQVWARLVCNADLILVNTQNDALLKAGAAWPHPWWLLLLKACGQWWCILPYQNSNDGTSLGHGVLQGLPTLYCCSTAQHLRDLC